MSWFSNATGRDKKKEQKAAAGGPGPGARYATAMTDYGGYAEQDRNRVLDILNGGQQAFETSAKAAVESALPSFRNELQGARESAIRRGVSNGETGMFGERDLADGFERNITNAISGQALGVYNTRLGASGGLMEGTGNTYLDLISGALDRKEQERNRKQGFYNSLINAGGQVAGSFFGGK
jgi:hypothetical protein